jgi:histidinol-phosphatase (PHP family)
VGYDYLIGSLHNLYVDGEYRNFDGIPEKHKAMVTDYFGGDGLAFAKEYYRQLAQLPDRAPIDIIGHYDLITRYQDTQPLFDWDDKSYRNAAIECAEALAGRVPLFELNCGAVIRGTRTTPYPQDFITKELKRLGFGVVITTDCHQKHLMDAWMEEGKEFLRSCGYTERHILTKDGFIPVPL